jgi:hypothetical protein
MSVFSLASGGERWFGKLVDTPPPSKDPWSPASNCGSTDTLDFPLLLQLPLEAPSQVEKSQRLIEPYLRLQLHELFSEVSVSPQAHQTFSFSIYPPNPEVVFSPPSKITSTDMHQLLSINTK